MKYLGCLGCLLYPNYPFKSEINFLSLCSKDLLNPGFRIGLCLFDPAGPERDFLGTSQRSELAYFWLEEAFGSLFDRINELNCNLLLIKFRPYLSSEMLLRLCNIGLFGFVFQKLFVSGFTPKFECYLLFKFLGGHFLQKDAISKALIDYFMVWIDKGYGSYQSEEISDICGRFGYVFSHGLLPKVNSDVPYLFDPSAKHQSICN